MSQEESGKYVLKTEQLIEGINHMLDKNRDTMAVLKRGNRSYRESIISISHDIRTPLTSAKGYTQMPLGEEGADMEHIFDRFYTTDQSRTRKTTGLGLAIVKLFAEKMGGKAEARLEKDIFSIEVAFPTVS